MCTLANVHLPPISPGKILIFASVFFSPRSSSASKMGKSTMSSADGDNKLGEEPITSRWQAGGSGLSTCHYLHIDISKSPDRPFLRLPQQAAAINPGKRMRGRVKKQSHCGSRPPFHTHTRLAHNVKLCRCRSTGSKVCSLPFEHFQLYLLAPIYLARSSLKIPPFMCSW